MEQLIDKILAVAGSALEAEDRLILGSVTANKTGSGGLLRINNERYYQFLVARMLMSSLPYIVEVEKYTHDLVLSEPTSDRPSVVIEMKRWMSTSGEYEIPGIKRDLSEKLVKANADAKIMMIFSANPRGLLEQNLIWLSDKLATNRAGWKSYCFNTLNLHGQDFEFWVALYLLE